MQLTRPADVDTETSRRSDVSMLVVNPDLPVFPGGGGVEFLTMTRLAGLTDGLGLASMAHTRKALEGARGLSDAGVELYLWESPHLDAEPGVRPPSTIRRLHARFRGWVDALKAWPDRPADTILLDACFRNMAPGLRRAMAGRHWNAIGVVQSTAAAMIDYLPRPPLSVLILHDIRSVVFERRAAASRSPLERWRLSRQARVYRAFERRYCQVYDLVTTVSPLDTEWVRTHYAPRRVITVPLPVHAGYFAPAADTETVAGRIVFTGLMNHPPNADAAVYFGRDVFPLVRQALPDAEFWIVGRDPTEEVRALSQVSGIHVTGGVPDIRPFLAQASVVVVPLRYGSGSRQKILEAWCMEKCVVSTTVGAEGLGFEDGVNLAIADDAAAMARTVVRGLREPEFRDALRRSGRLVATRDHDPLRVATDYHRELQAALDEKRQLDTPMRIALDMRWMLPGLAGGLENLARSFVSQLKGIDRYNAYTAIVPSVCRHDFDLPRDSNIRVLTQDSWREDLQRLRRRVSRALHARLRLDYWESPDVLELRFARSLDADIAYSFPGYIRPDLHPLRQVLMVPDIQHEYCPQFFTTAALEERRRLYGEAIARADHICAISEFTRQTLIDRLQVSPDKVTAIPLAADPLFSAPPVPAREAAVRRRYGLETAPYFYFPGHTWHHKNHRAAIEALRILRDRHGRRPLLVCSGGAREAQPELERQIDALGLQAQVRFLGYCPREEVPALYRGAVALVFPSLFEGFGIPVLEAMASGCPVVCSNSTSLPEIAGDAALLVDPADTSAWADAMRRLLDEGTLRDDLRARGRAQAARFSWLRHTWETIAVFHRVHRQVRAA